MGAICCVFHWMGGRAPSIIRYVGHVGGLIHDHSSDTFNIEERVPGCGYDR